ncbi:transporter [Ganoderma sinense ZZ0214-1]|uniref:Transporter n=1 Tax=Ganoderma sinense ZZ0214-1 TaxID=1077348 RepID=A0A2G8SI80_9APHY|nr:transporter [Ganoderma sinense ZZ0214-1]
MAIPDEDFHPVATGQAAKTVEAHQAPQDVVFYAGWFCPFVQRVWITLEERGIPYQYQEINPYKREAHFLEINPKGLVPAIEHKGRGLYESLVLCEFLEDAFPDPTNEPHLLPADPIDRGHARIWVDYAAKVVVPAHSRLIQAQGAERQRAALEEYYAALRTFAAQIRGPWFLGEQFSLVDVALAPWMVRDWVVAEHRGFSRAAVGNGWKEYVDRLERRESIVKTTSERQHLEVIYGRYLRDEAQSEQAKAIRAGKTF